jgi:hypothetical protein
VTSPTVDITVLPPPDGFDPDRWMTAKSLTISHNWSRSGDTLKAGDAVKLTIDMVAVGTVAAQLKPTPVPEIAGVKIHADPPALDDQMGSETNTATRSETWTFALTKSGTFEVSEIRIPWWNYETDSRQEIVIPANTLTVTDNPDLDPDLVSPADTSEAVTIVTQRRSWWPPSWPAVFLVLVLIFGIFAAIRSRRRHAELASTAGAGSVLEVRLDWDRLLDEAASKRDGSVFRSQLTRWLSGREGAPPGRAQTAEEFAAVVKNSKLAAQFDRLDQSLYARDAAGESGDLGSQINAEIKSAVSHVSHAGIGTECSGTLPELNPRGTGPPPAPPTNPPTDRHD